MSTRSMPPRHRAGGRGHPLSRARRQAEGRALLAREQSRPRRRKFGNVPAFVGTERLDSKREARDFGDLLVRERIGEIRKLRRQTKHTLRVDGRLVTTYRDDVSYEERAGDAWVRVIHDSKGHKTEAFVIKWNLMQALHPDWRFVLS